MATVKSKKDTVIAKKDKVIVKKEKLGAKNPNAMPRIEKVVVACGIGSLVTRKWHKDFDEFEKNLIKITGQKPQMIKSRKSISNFKLREWLPVMLRVTLRKKKAYDFMDRFVKLVLPRVRDFSWLSEKSFDHQANFNMWLVNYNVFPELNVDDVVTPIWLQITVVTSTKDTEKAKELLKGLGLIFK